jgi:hypothetical protein
MGWNGRAKGKGRKEEKRRRRRERNLDPRCSRQIDAAGFEHQPRQPFAYFKHHPA